MVHFLDNLLIILGKKYSSDSSSSRSSSSSKSSSNTSSSKSSRSRSRSFSSSSYSSRSSKSSRNNSTESKKSSKISPEKLKKEQNFNQKNYGETSTSNNVKQVINSVSNPSEQVKYLFFKKNDLIKATSNAGNGWCCGGIVESFSEMNKIPRIQGFFPVNYVQTLTSGDESIINQEEEEKLTQEQFSH